MYAVLHGELRSLGLPDPEALVLPGVRWGKFDELLTPAYWKGQAWQHEAVGTYSDFAFGHTLAEETAGCLLGGYGMPAEIGVAAFLRLRDEELLNSTTDAKRLEAALAEPFLYQGRPRLYRFPRQKAKYLERCLAALAELREPSSDTALRDALARLPGIGPKTASWIVRNYRKSNVVAVIDVHIIRAGRHIGLFDQEWTPQRDYRLLEDALIQFAGALQVSLCLLDSVIWDYMRRVRNRHGDNTDKLPVSQSALLLLPPVKVQPPLPQLL